MVTAETQEAGPPPDDGARLEAQALCSLVARAHGLDSIPLPSGGQVELLDPEQAVSHLEDPDHVPAPVRLELLAELVRGESPPPEPYLQRLADSLVLQELEERQSVIDDLLARLRNAQRGQDALGRTVQDLHNPQDFFSRLETDVLAARFLALPMCEAGTTPVGGHLALNIKTTLDSTRRIGAFPSIVDPERWPDCPIQSIFFKRMDRVLPPRPAALGEPDTGVALTLLEIVDFSYGFDPTGGSDMRTDLSFVSFTNPDAVGCTYDLARSVDGKVNVDQGYLLVEDLDSHAVRRFTTLKQVAFTDRPLPPSGRVCLVWSIMQALIVASCLAQ